MTSDGAVILTHSLSLPVLGIKNAKLQQHYKERKKGNTGKSRIIGSQHPLVSSSQTGCHSQWGICLPDADCQKVRRGTLSRTTNTRRHTNIRVCIAQNIDRTHSLAALKQLKKLNFLIARFQINPNSASKRTPRVQPAQLPTGPRVKLI